MARKDLVKVTATLTVSGTLYPLGEFSTMTGGDFDSGELKRSGGAGQGKRARGGKKLVSNVVISREDDGSVDINWLKDQRNERLDIYRTPLDDDGNPLTARMTHYTGKLKRVTPGEADTESEDEADTFEIEQSTDAI
jgi:hypothetical protein